MKKFKNLFIKVDGIAVLKQYVAAHVLCFALFQIILNGFSKKSLEIVRLSVENKIMKKMRKKYKNTIQNILSKYDWDNLEHIHENIIWFCWFQGIEQAPDIVLNCYDSLKKVDNMKIIIITKDNYKKYVSLPKFIIEKYEKNIISNAHFSDILRLELLIKYGGTWIDSTVYCSTHNIPDYMIFSKLFLFQNLKPGLDGHCSRISNWFITAESNQPILIFTRDLIYSFWKENNKVKDYFFFHRFFEMAIECFPESWNKVYPYSNSTPHILLLRLFDNYDQSIWNIMKQSIPFHKLTYKFDSSQITKQSYFFNIFNDNKEQKE